MVLWLLLVTTASLWSLSSCVCPSAESSLKYLSDMFFAAKTSGGHLVESLVQHSKSKYKLWVQYYNITQYSSTV